MLKKLYLLFWALCLMPMLSFSQGITPTGQNKGTLETLGGAKIDSMFWLPVRPLIKWPHANNFMPYIGGLQVNPADTFLYYMKKDGVYYKVLTTADSFSVIIDSTIWCTKWYREKGDDSVMAASLAALADTASSIRSSIPVVSGFATHADVGDTANAIRSYLLIAIGDTAANVRSGAQTNLVDTAAAIRSSIPNVSNFATHADVGDTATNVRTYLLTALADTSVVVRNTAQTNLIDTAIAIRAAFPSTAGLATTVALTDTAIARAATAQTNLVDTAAVLRTLFGSAVTGLTVNTANGFKGTFTPGPTPALTMSTTVTSGSLVKTSSGALVPAVSGTDYMGPTVTGPINISSNTSSINAQTGTGSVLVVQNSPTLTGTPAAPTPATNDNSTTIPTTAWVKNQGYSTGSFSVVPGANINVTGTTTVTIALTNTVTLTAQVYSAMPTTPAAGSANIAITNMNGIEEALITPSTGLWYTLQPDLGNLDFGRMTCNGTAPVFDGRYTSALSNFGTASFNLRAYDASNLAPNSLYYKLATNAAPNSSAELLFGFTGRDALINNSAYAEGSKLEIMFCLPNYASTQRFFVGYTSTFSQMTTLADPSSVLNTVGVGKDVTDNTIQLMFNNGSGTATKINTGITPTVNDVYVVTVLLPSNTSYTSVGIERRTKTASTLFGASNTSKVPSANTLMYMHAQSNSGSGSAAVSIGIMHIFEIFKPF